MTLYIFFFIELDMESLFSEWTKLDYFGVVIAFLLQFLLDFPFFNYCAGIPKRQRTQLPMLAHSAVETAIVNHACV